MSARQWATFCKIQIRVQINYPKEMHPFLTTGNLLLFPFIRALSCEMCWWSVCELCVDSGCWRGWLNLWSWWQGWKGSAACTRPQGCITELLVHGVTHGSRESHEQVSGLVCVIQNWCLTEHLICKVCETPDSCKGEILRDTLSLVAIQLMNWGYFVHPPCVGICAWNLAMISRWK